MAKYYKNDPYWINVRYPGTCAACGAKLNKGARAFYYPRSKKLFGSDCCHAGDTESASFEAAALDEWAYNGFR